MMIGPEPITRMRWRSARRGMYQVVEDVVDGALRRPARRLPKFVIVSDEDRNIDRAEQVGIARNVSGHAKTLENALRQLPYRRSLTAADVIHLAGHPLLEQLHVGVDDVRH